MYFQIVTEDLKRDLRQKFINEFVNSDSEHFKKYIDTLKQYPDGLCYDGYLWDCLKIDYSLRETTMEQAILYLKNKSRVFVMWDIFSKYRVPIKRILSDDYPKDTIIEIDSLELCQVIQNEWCNQDVTKGKYLPEDIYVFDNTMNWYVVFTHEGYESSIKPELGEDDDYIRICFVHEQNL